MNCLVALGVHEITDSLHNVSKNRKTFFSAALSSWSAESCTSQSLLLGSEKSKDLPMFLVFDVSIFSSSLVLKAFSDLSTLHHKQESRLRT